MTMPDVSKAAQLWGELYALLCKKPELQNALGSIAESELARLDDLAEKIIEKYLARDQEVQMDDESDRYLLPPKSTKRLFMGEWQPIETAPKDGRAVLLLSMPYSHEADGTKIDYPARCNIGKWNAEGTSWVDEHGQLNDEVYHHLATTGIWESGGGWFQPNEISHWMPLPEPPTIP